MADPQGRLVSPASPHVSMREMVHRASVAGWVIGVAGLVALVTISQFFWGGELSGTINSLSLLVMTGAIPFLMLAYWELGGLTPTPMALVAQSLASRRPDDATRFGWASVRLGLGLFGVVGLLEGVLFTPQIVHFISHSEAVRAAAIGPMRMMGVVTPIIAVAMILSEALFGAGNTKFVAAAQFCLVFLVLGGTGFLLPFFLEDVARFPTSKVGLLLAISPIVGVLTHAALVPTPAALVPPPSGSIDIPWAIAQSRRKSALAARRAASRNPFAMHA